MKQQYLCYVYTRYDIILNDNQKVLETQYSISMHDIYNETIPAGWLAVAKERDLPELSSLTSLSW